jgi:hypothetical protein
VDAGNPTVDAAAYAQAVRPDELERRLRERLDAFGPGPGEREPFEAWIG